MPPISQGQHSLSVQLPKLIAGHVPLLRRIPKLPPSMEDTQVIDILNITLLKVKHHSVLLGSVMQSIKGFSLGFRDGRDVIRPWQAPVPCECPPRILDDQSFRGCFGSGLVV
jgi:hypothetical protein